VIHSRTATCARRLCVPDGQTPGKAPVCDESPVARSLRTRRPLRVIGVLPRKGEHEGMDQEDVVIALGQLSEYRHQWFQAAFSDLNANLNPAESGQYADRLYPNQQKPPLTRSPSPIQAADSQSWYASRTGRHLYFGEFAGRDSTAMAQSRSCYANGKSACATTSR